MGSGVPSSGFTYRTANSIREAESESRSTSFECSSWPNDSIDSGIRNSSESKQQESVMKLRHRLDEAKQVFNPIKAKNSSCIQDICEPDSCQNEPYDAVETMSAKLRNKLQESKR